MKNNIIKQKLSGVSAAMLVSLVITDAMAAPAIWVQPVPGGEVRLYDWGYEGPGARKANTFESINGFNGAAQLQRVITTGPDKLTPDAPQGIREDLGGSIIFRKSNMDSQTNFYKWGYTTVAGSVFSNMQIDADGDYFIARNDMNFAWYGVFDYTWEGDPTVDPASLFNGVPNGIYPTNVQFQPYALSDAKGWCGSVLTSNPASLEPMGGQVTFDFGFEAFLPFTPTGDNGVWDPGEGSMQIVKDFEMRSFGSLEVDLGAINYKADAVVNNTSPLNSPVVTDANGDPVMIEVPLLNMDGTPALDANGVARTQIVPQMEVGVGGVDGNYYNLVSFMGGGVVPKGVWVEWADPAASKTNDNIVAVLYDTDVVDADGDGIDDNNPNIVYHKNSFGGYGFLLRADGIRIIEGLNFAEYPDISNVPNKTDLNGNGRYDRCDTVSNNDYDPVTGDFFSIEVKNLDPNARVCLRNLRKQERRRALLDGRRTTRR